MKPLLVAAATLSMVPLLAVAGPAQADGHLETIAEGFISPLSLAVANDGTLYVSELFAGRLTAVAPSGAMTTVTEGSVAGVDATGRGTLTVTLSGPPEEGGAPLGEVARVSPTGALRAVGSPLDHEIATNPDADQTYGFENPSDDCAAAAEPFGFAPYSGIVESNPYAVAIDGSDRIVADAAGNSIVRVRPNGRTSTVAVLPPVEVEFTEELRVELIGGANEGVPPEEQIPADALSACTGSTYLSEPVPTDVEVGPDGHYYVSSLPGFPEAPGSGGVFRVDRSTGDVERLHDGFSGAVDLAVAADGTVYVAELFAFQVTEVDPSGHRTSMFLPSPGAVEVGRDGTVYATSGVFDQAGNGSVVRLGF